MDLSQRIQAKTDNGDTIIDRAACLNLVSMHTTSIVIPAKAGIQGRLGPTLLRRHPT